MSRGLQRTSEMLDDALRYRAEVRLKLLSNPMSGSNRIYPGCNSKVFNRAGVRLTLLVRLRPSPEGRSQARSPSPKPKFKPKPVQA